MKTYRSESGAAPWKPPSGPQARIELHTAGVKWDAVRVPADLGERTLRWLGEFSGSALTDGNYLYWLVEPGAAAGWKLPDVTVISSAGYLVIPPEHRTIGPGPHWHIPFAADRYLTPPLVLYDALHVAGRRRAS